MHQDRERSHCYRYCYQPHSAGMGRTAAPVPQTSLTGSPGPLGGGGWARLPHMWGAAPRFSPRWQMTHLPGPADASAMQHPINALTPFT